MRKIFITIAVAQAVLLVDNDPRYHTRMGAHVSTDVIDIFEN
jgi:hypothetical protein